MGGKSLVFVVCFVIVHLKCGFFWADEFQLQYVPQCPYLTQPALSYARSNQSGSLRSQAPAVALAREVPVPVAMQSVVWIRWCFLRIRIQHFSPIQIQDTQAFDINYALIKSKLVGTYRCTYCKLILKIRENFHLNIHFKIYLRQKRVANYLQKQNAQIDKIPYRYYES